MPLRDVREHFKKWPRLYYFIGVVFGPMLFSGLSASGFLRKYPRHGSTLNIGSGPRRYADPSVQNVDILPYPGVAIVAPADRIPLADASVARIFSDNVLEHLTDPVAAVAEMQRLLEPGGVAYVAVPFLYPFHSSPSDYQRFTSMGLRELFKGFEIVELGVRAGPFSALTAWLNHLIGVLLSFGSPGLESVFTNIVMFLTFPLKLPDVILNHWPGAEKVAAVLYCVVRKNGAR